MFKTQTPIRRSFMIWMAHLSINRRLLLASVIVAIIPGLVISLLGSVQLQVLNVYGQAVQVSTDGVTTATTQMANLQQMNANLISLQSGKFVASTVNGSQDAHVNRLKQDLNEEITKLQIACKQTLLKYQQSYQLATSDNMESVRRQLANDKTLPTIQEEQRNTLTLVVQQEWPSYIQAQNRELQALQSNQPSAITYNLLLTANEKFAPLQKDWDTIVTLAETVSNNVAQIDAAYKFDFTVCGIVASLIIMAVVVFIGYAVHLTISRPLSDLVKLTRRISKGDTTARIDIKGNDEIYLVAESMNSMMDNIVQLIQEVQTQRDILQEKIEHLVTEVREIGEGNLQVQPEVTPDTLGAIAVFFHDLTEALSNLIIRVKMASREVEATTTVTQAMLTQLVDTNNTQFLVIARTMAEIDQMAHSSRRVAERTRMLSSVAQGAQSAIEKGRISVEQAIDGMRRIHENVRATATQVQKLDEHSNQIDSIITVISTISQKMRILAQDAAMQAALAGEHGKGFAVVASDIQRLAERTASQVNSIAHLVNDVYEDITSATLSMRNTELESSYGAKLALEAGSSLETIFAAAEHQAREMVAINQIATQQLQSFSTLDKLMNLISQSTQQISTTTRTASQNLTYLTRQVQELHSSVEAFNLRETSSLPSITTHTDLAKPLSSHMPRLLKHLSLTTPSMFAVNAEQALLRGKDASASH